MGIFHLIKKILSNVACSKAYIDTLSNDNWTALAFAAQFGSFEMLRLLVEEGKADVNIRLGGGHIALTLGLQVFMKTTLYYYFGCISVFFQFVNSLVDF